MTVTPIVALDVPTIEEALSLVDRLSGACRFYKVGSELFTAAGPHIVTALRERGCDVFLDLKFHDIPNTVRRAAAAAAHIGATMITVHASGGEAMLRAAVEGAEERCHVFAVTVLTSLDASALAAAWGHPTLDLLTEVLRLAAVAASAGVTGVVCSGQEAPLLQHRFGHTLKLLVPGIRLPGSPPDDQSRTVTPAEAAAAGASYIILGRTITRAPDPVAALHAAMGSLT